MQLKVISTGGIQHERASSTCNIYKIHTESHTSVFLLYVGGSQCIIYRRKSLPKAGFTVIRVQVRVCLHDLARIAIYCKQCYVTRMLRHVGHNNDIIIDVKTF